MMVRPALSVMLTVVLVAFASHSLSAQTTAAPADTALSNAVARARGLIDKGDGTAARAVLDSLVRVQEIGSDALAESLYWRAVLAENASEAERDWQRLVIETGLSPRVPDALLWLGELEIVRGHGTIARGYFQRLLRDFPDAPQRPRAELWVARSYFDGGDRAVGCARANALRAKLPEGEVRLQADDLVARCAAYDAAAAAAAAAPPTDATTPPADATGPKPRDTDAKPAANGRYTVQLAAFGTRREAESAATRLAKAGVSTRIVGTRKPFRVQTGRYATRAEATKALASLKKRGQKGFVAEVPR